MAFLLALFRAILDDWRVYNRPLSASEINSLMTINPPRIASGPWLGFSDAKEILLSERSLDGYDQVDIFADGHYEWVINKSAESCVKPDC